jgi:ABC-2 type transport system ATP-binding protein
MKGVFMTQVIKTNNLTKKYNKFTALDDVSMQVNRGDIYGLIGKNGAGKTTFFKLLMGLASQTSGQISIGEGQNLLQARNNIGFMIGTSFFPYLNARQNIEYYRKLKGIKDKEETSRVLELAGLAGINKPFKSFSMGMKQRLGLANALLGNPPIVILDEPINGLDPQGIQHIRNLIKKIHAESNTTFLISSHILSELELVATRFGFIDHGKLLKELTYEELHQYAHTGVVIEVDNVERAIGLLEKKLQVKKCVRRKNREILLEGYEDETDKIAKVIVDGDLKLYAMKDQTITLEEYYLQLIGGEANV